MVSETESRFSIVSLLVVSIKVHLRLECISFPFLAKFDKIPAAYQETLFLIHKEWEMDNQTATLQITNGLRRRNFSILCIFQNYQKDQEKMVFFC